MEPRVRVLLINPDSSLETVRRSSKLFVLEPLALEYIAAGLQAEHEVRIVDLCVERWPDRAFAQALRKYRPEVVGFTGYCPHGPRVRQLARRSKRLRPDALVIVGGQHATVLPQDFCLPEIDVIVIGDGVSACREVLHAYQRGHELDQIPGLALPKNGQLSRTPERPLPQLDSLPLPARDLVDRRRYYDLWFHTGYRTGERLHQPTAALRTSAGCKHHCVFCAQWRLNQGKYFTRSPESVVAELSQIEEPCVYFVDDETFLDVDRMLKLADLIEREGIEKRYFGWVRTSTVIAQPELMRRWRSIGLDRVFVGVESFADEALKAYHKGSTVADNKRAVALLQELEIAIVASIIVDPDYSMEDFSRVREAMAEYPDCEFSFSVLSPAPGSLLMKKRKDELTTDNFDLMDGLHTLLPTRLPLKEFYAQFASLFQEARKHSMFRWIRPSFRDLLPLIYRAHRFYAAIRNGYRDHAPALDR